MQKTLSTALKDSFSEAMKAHMPAFRYDSVSKFGSVIYRQDIAENLTAFIRLGISPKRDQFTIELAWSRNGEYPFDIFTILPSDPPKNNSLRFSLSRLWQEAGSDFWWKFTKSRLDPDYRDEPIEELLPKVDGLVKDAIGKTIEYAVPYFKSLR